MTRPNRCRSSTFCWGVLLVASFSIGPFAAAGVCSLEWTGDVGQPGMSSSIRAFTVMPGETGSILYAGGFFTQAGGIPANHIANWDGEVWRALGTGVNDAVLALASFDDGTGPALFATGAFTSAGGMNARGIAKWQNQSWSFLANGLGGGDGRALVVFDDGNGPALYVGGNFLTAGSTIVNCIARWDGSAWSGVGGGTADPSAAINALAVFDDGRGPALYAGGRFETIGGVSASNIAKWNGSEWSALGRGTSGEVAALTVHDDGRGPALFVGGTFSMAGGMTANRVARWDGAEWTALGDGATGGLLGVQALEVFDSGLPNTTPELYAGGGFSTADGMTVNNIARWDGSAWNPVGNGVAGGPLPAVIALQSYDDGSGRALVAGGTFELASGVNAMRVARWRVIGLPQLIESPNDVELTIGDDLTLTVDAASSTPISYQWRRDGAELDDGGRVSGATTATLMIDAAQLDDAGVYDVVLTNTCGSLLSDAAVVGVTASPGDLNADGDVNVFDLLILLGAWGDCPAKGACPADLNGDDVVNVFDLLTLLSNWG